MATPLQERLLTAAQAFSPLTALLGSAAAMRWYFDSLQQGSAYPAIVTQRISGSRQYSVYARMQTGFSRFQFTIWGGQYKAGADARDQVAQALLGLMDTFNGSGVGPGALNQYSNVLLLDRESLFVQTDTPVYLRIMDFSIFDNDTL